MFCSQAREATLLLADMASLPPPPPQSAPAQEKVAAAVCTRSRQPLPCPLKAACSASTVGLTFYRAIDDEPEQTRSTQGLRVHHEPLAAAYESSRPKRAAVSNRKQLQGLLWHIDAGLVASSSAWRAEVAKLTRRSTGDCAGKRVGKCAGDGAGGSVGAYGAHVAAYHQQVGLASSHSDELAMAEFMLEGEHRDIDFGVRDLQLDGNLGGAQTPRFLSFVRRSAALRSHVLHRRAQSISLPTLSKALTAFLDFPSPEYSGRQLVRAVGAPEEVREEHFDLFGRGKDASERLEWGSCSPHREGSEAEAAEGVHSACTVSLAAGHAVGSAMRNAKRKHGA